MSVNKCRAVPVDCQQKLFQTRFTPEDFYVQCKEGAEEPRASPETMHNQILHHIAVLLVVCTLVLVIAGAFVADRNASAVGSWTYTVHRIIAATVGILTLALNVLVWKLETRSRIRILGLIALGMVVFEGMLGSVAVGLSLPKAFHVLHDCLAQLFFCATAAIALFTSKSWLSEPRRVRDGGWPSLRSLSVFTCILVFGQVVLGASVRHDTIPAIPHIVGAMVVIGVVIILSVFVLTQFSSHEILRKSALALMLITFVQVFIGIAAFLNRAAMTQTPDLPGMLSEMAHAATGSLTFGAAVILSIQVFRNILPRSSVQLTSQNMSAAS